MTSRSRIGIALGAIMAGVLLTACADKAFRPPMNGSPKIQLQLNTVGERVSERELIDTMLSVCARNGWQAVSFHVAPINQRIAAGQTLNCHEWWLELRTHTAKTPTANVLAPEFDAELARRNRDYVARRANGSLGAPFVRLVIPGVFERWAHEQRTAGRSAKLPFCRSDRRIADQLAALTRFHEASLDPFPITSPRLPG